MSARSQPDFRIIPLETNLLTTPFRIQTNWHVITGAPSCGKTTLINLLIGRGFQTTAEGARLYLERELASGRTIEQIRANEADLQRGIKNAQLAIELGLQADHCIFLDSAIPDCLAWHRYFGLNPNEFLQECFCNRYASVFFLDRLPYQLDGLRYQDDALPRFLEEWQIRDYLALGYRITRVPVMPPEERLAFILGVLSEQG